MTAPIMTYDSLVNDLLTYPDREDAPYIDQVPRLIMLAENRIASEVRGLGYIRYATAAFAIGTPVYVKPSRWRQTISLQYVNNVNKRATLFPRTLEFCRTYWPQGISQTRAPKYYADYDYEHFLIAATPDGAYPFELAYHEKPLELSMSNQTNWTTQYNPQVLLYASLMEAAIWRKRWDEAKTFEEQYNRAAQTLVREDQIRESDRSIKAGEDR